MSQDYHTTAWSPEAREELRGKLDHIPDRACREVIEELLAQDDPAHLIATLRGALSGVAERIKREGQLRCP